MFHAIYDDSGRIVQANKVFAPTEEYQEQLRHSGQRFVTDAKASLLPPDDWYVAGATTSAPALRKRPNLSVLTQRRAIKAGGAERALLVGVPKAALVTMTMGGDQIYQGTPGEAELEFACPIPGIYRVAIDLWPARLFVCEIEAVA
ncbi:hypothetical protein Rpal_3338 [Rhodopseudomonas palustris TIE-1]|uniref:hypothetical protein n=1 Tax=Rhodopseudomonas palustris TaxID=1076 RepID=UPI000164AA4F|nr:hypothetical protein [Rhodopseudomonas palustris]ACF01840.1 hypothetical protein Rpal_3338 [Rhodopseudomonas palustris TIE-1]